VKKYLLTSALSLSIAAPFAALAQNGTSFTPDQTKEIQQIMHDYLVKNPQVLIEASQALQQQQMAKIQQAASKAISNNIKDIFSNPDSPVIGNPSGDVTLVEFMDYQCVHCKEMTPVIGDLIKANPKLRVIFKELPIFGPTSEYAAKAALAAQKQNKYAAFHDALMNDSNPLSKDEVLKIAKSVGLDTDKLEKDINDPSVDKQLKDNFRLAQELNLVGTPAIVVGNRQGSKTAFVPGTASKENLQQLITQVTK
jgi:protein-disulfide isomerase